jgi:6-hydroxycyclohex-1-ene-1-carbonyl-CoA dehydrogenase
MPGNDINGGFATHLMAPAQALVSLADAPSNIDIDSLSVVADAVSTASQAIRRSELCAGDVAFVVGCGGVGGFTAQIARALGARVIVCDVDGARLAQAETHGADAAVDVRGRSPKDVRAQVHGLAKEYGVPSLGWRVFECSGTTAGQALAYNLLGPAATLLIVGFTRGQLELRLSNLMAFDATVHGSWGCPLEAYPAVLQLIYSGQVVIEPLIERAPMSHLDELITALAEHRLSRRMVLDPRA